MDENKSESTGTVGFERGTISEKKPDTLPDRFLYKVQSSTREGVATRWMESVNAAAYEYRGSSSREEKYQYAVGDAVYYFMFPDGRGMVLGKVRKDL